MMPRLNPSFSSDLFWFVLSSLGIILLYYLWYNRTGSGEFVLETVSQQVEVVGEAETVEAIFKFANKSSREVTVINAYAGCDCLLIELPFSVPANSTVDIHAQFTGISQLPVNREVEFTTRPWLPNLIASVSFVGAPTVAGKRIEVDSNVGGHPRLNSPSLQDVHSVIIRSGGK